MSTAAATLGPAAERLPAAPVPGSGLRVEWLRDLAAIECSLPAWQALWRSDPAAGLFAGPDWLAWLVDRFGPDGGPASLALHDGSRFEPVDARPWQPRIATVWDDAGALRAVLPLVATDGLYRGARRRLLASPLNFHAPRSGITAARFDAAVARRLAEAIAADDGWDVLLLDGLPAADGRADLLACALAAGGLTAERRSSWPSARLRFEGDFDAHLEGPERAHFRRSLVKSRNGLAKLGALEWQCLRGQEALDTGLTAFFEVDAASWKAGSGESVGRDDALRAHYTALCVRLARADWLEVWLLRLDGRPIAGFICPNDGRMRYTLKSSFIDGVGGNRSPSLVLLHGLVQQAWAAWQATGDAGGIDFVGKVAFLDRWASDDLLFETSVWWRSRLRLQAARWRGRLAGRWNTLRGRGAAGAR